MTADDPKVLANLKRIMGKINPFTQKLLHVNSTYNDIIFTYWHYFDNYGKTTFQPNRLTSVEPINRAIRLLPGREKNIKMELRIRRYYS